MTTMQEQPPPWQVDGDLPPGWYGTRVNLLINCAEELYAPIHPALLRRLPWPQRARVVVVRRIDRKHRSFSYEAKVVRVVLWRRCLSCAPYDEVVRAVASYTQDDPEEFVYAAVTDRTALLSVMIRVDER